MPLEPHLSTRHAESQDMVGATERNQRERPRPLPHLELGYKRLA